MLHSRIRPDLGLHLAAVHAAVSGDVHKDRLGPLFSLRECIVQIIVSLKSVSQS